MLLLLYNSYVAGIPLARNLMLPASVAMNAIMVERAILAWKSLGSIRSTRLRSQGNLMTSWLLEQDIILAGMTMWD